MGNGDTQLICFLEAEGMRHPLADLAEEASPSVRAQLLAHASTSAAIMGDPADVPYALARAALLADATCRPTHQAFEDSLYGYTDDVFDDILQWRLEENAAAEPALTAARKVRDAWAADDQKRLADLEAALS